MDETRTPFLKAFFREAVDRKSSLGTEEKKLLDALQELADTLSSEKVFSATLSSGIAKRGNYVALKVMHVQSRCSETFYIDFAQSSAARSLRFSTGAARRPFGQDGKGGVSKAECGYCIQFSDDRAALLEAMGEHMARKVNAQKLAKAASLYVLDSKK